MFRGPARAPGSAGGPTFKETPPCGAVTAACVAVKCEGGPLTSTC